MDACALIGDELTAAGFRLAGFDVYVPAPEEATTCFEKLLEKMELLIITAEIAQTIPDELLHQAAIHSQPLILVIPDVRGRTQPTDLAADLRQQLGMAE